MAKTTGITLYECDRCGTKEYALGANSMLSDWHEVARTTKDMLNKSFLLCGSCFKDYYAIVESQDITFVQWMDKGKEIAK